MAQYECSECGYVYDEEKGESASGTKLGTSFDDLPDTYVCPICGAGKAYFVKI